MEQHFGTNTILEKNNFEHNVFFEFQISAQSEY